MSDYKEQLNTARQMHQLAKDMSKTPAQAKQAISNSFNLVKHIDPFMDWLYGIALALAILKDILDYVIIGTLIGPIISLLIFFVMLITGSFFQARWARRVGVVIFGTMAEFFLGINFLPVETLVVVLVFYMTLLARAQAARKKAVQANIAVGEAYAV